MVQRRTRALVELVMAAIGLFVQLYLWKSLWDDVEEWDEPVHASVSGLIAGALYGSGYLWVHDRDVGNIRTNRRRGLLISVCSQRVRRRIFPRTKEFRSNFGVGTLIGTIGYRLWYGLFHPLPNGDK